MDSDTYILGDKNDYNTTNTHGNSETILPAHEEIKPSGFRRKFCSTANRKVVLMKNIDQLLEKYNSRKAPPCTLVYGDSVFSDDDMLLGRVHS